MEKRIEQIEKKLKLQRAYTLITSCALGLFLLLSFTGKNNDVIRAKGIVIVDDQGRERILIGAPIPEAKNRVRTNLERVQEIWGKKMSKEYMGWYKNYNHSANGMVILDENGFDRVAIGDTPDPNIGKRTGPGTGVIINDELGFERTGYQLLNVKGKNRMVLGLDRPGGTEGVTVAILEDGTAGVTVINKGTMGFMGSAPQNGLMTGLDNSFFGLMFRDKSTVKYNINSEGKQTAQISTN
ncbi:hypothetical protein [Pontibacter cellulosilyticus]|uniref:Phosphodiester glycosidase domain-containing protein n=1 Tax=Pontibacter cellulosilyticus TaxID=1720253 RepID=A0A923NAT2_9BACT|nr:hypothetical protein [Pontibacter cellulosilyticus]MBC5994501.1 hypothetical protein [Pontibacter cellulosilyticus]